MISMLQPALAEIECNTIGFLFPIASDGRVHPAIEEVTIEKCETDLDLNTSLVC
jgi:hypothetical protein